MVGLILIATFFSFNLFNQCSGGYPCLNLQPMTDFDAEKYVGVWYAAARFLNGYDKDCKCILFNYTQGSNALNLKADTVKKSDNSPFIFYPTFSYLHDQSVADFNCTSEDIDPGHWIHMTLIETDYLTYQFLYACDDKYKQEYAWISTRDRQISDHAYEKLISVVKKYLQNTDDFIRVDQTDCNN